FDSQAIMMTSGALFFYSLGIIGFGLRDVLSRAFYSMQDTKTPAINAAIAVALNIILNLVLSKFMGLSGLALATSISAVFGTFLLFISLRKKIGPFGSKIIVVSFAKIIAASLIMGLAAKFVFVKTSFSFGQNLSLLMAIAVGGFVYVIAIFILKLGEAQLLLGLIKGRINNKKKLPKD
ncbi:MAG: murein biosynthesis integral membrane protein MurJ, partial [Clostridiales bacterium]|nr:murein biosynthesis integral membrane protein MurJ [Clostridiales bacterium]